MLQLLPMAEVTTAVAVGTVVVVGELLKFCDRRSCSESATDGAAAL